MGGRLQTGCALVSGSGGDAACAGEGEAEGHGTGLSLVGRDGCPYRHSGAIRFPRALARAVAGASTSGADASAVASATRSPAVHRGLIKAFPRCLYRGTAVPPSWRP